MWAGLTIVTSFVWGSTLLEEKLKSAGGSGGGIALLVLGIVMVAVCNSPLPDKLFLTEGNNSCGGVVIFILYARTCLFFFL